MRKRRMLIAVGVLLLVGVVFVVWEINDWPPIHLIVKYGFPPTGGPTGNTRVIEGVEFVELRRGYVWVDAYYPSADGRGGDLIGRICWPLGVRLGSPPKFATVRHVVGHWVEVVSDYWIMRDWGSDALPAWLPGTSSRDLSGPIDAVRDLLGAAESGVFRLPTREEWESAEAIRILDPDHVPDGFPDYGPGLHFSRVYRYLTFRDGVETLTTTFDGSSWLGFRLVWIPPEDE